MFKEKLDIVNGICKLDIVPDSLKLKAKVDLARTWMIYRKGAYAEEMYDIINLPKKYLSKFKSLIDLIYEIKTGRDFRAISEATQDLVIGDRNRLDNLVEIPIKWYVAYNLGDKDSFEDVYRSLTYLCNDDKFARMVDFICRFCRSYIGPLKRDDIESTEEFLDRILFSNDNFDNYNQKDIVVEAFMREMDKSIQDYMNIERERAHVSEDVHSIMKLTSDIDTLFYGYNGSVDDDFKDKIMELDKTIGILKTKLNIESNK